MDGPPTPSSSSQAPNQAKMFPSQRDQNSLNQAFNRKPQPSGLAANFIARPPKETLAKVGEQSEMRKFDSKF